MTAKTDQEVSLEQEFPETIYHYCSFENFESIVKSKTFWLSHTSGVNDWSEGTWLKDGIEQRLSSRRTTQNSGLLDNAIKALDHLKGGLYAGCFSADDDRLSQWRAYASGGSGVAIGLQVSSLNVPETHKFYNKMSSRIEPLVRMKYTSKFPDDEIDAQILRIQDFNTNKVKDDKVAGSVLATTIRRLLSRHKNDAFEEENELRFIYEPPAKSSSEFPFIVAQKEKTIHFRHSGSQLVSYVELPLDGSDGGSALTKVIMGPKNETADDVIIEFLRQNKFTDVEITRSRATLR